MILYIGVTRRLKGLYVPMSTQNTAVKIYNLPLIHKKESGISVYEIGNPIPGQPFIEKVLILLGATGAGKTTLINRMVNHIYGVQWDDDFRFQLISEEIAKSQTLITIYTIYPSLESHFPHTLTIVDTPSFTDAKHDQIFQQIKGIFSNAIQGIDHLDGIGFVIQSSLVNLTIEQRMFNSIVSIFGNDVANNIFMMVTFADASKPPVITAIKEANIKFKRIFKFNNSALFVSNSSRCGCQENDFNSIFWKLGINSFKYFFESLCDVEQISLCLTKEVLRKRKHLEVAHQAVQQQIDMSVTKLEELKQEDNLHQREAILAGNKHFPWQVLAIQVDNPPNVYSTNCSVCEYTCHVECNAPHVYDCLSMDNGGEDAAHCKYCPQKCHWKEHKLSPYYYKIYIEQLQETAAFQELQASDLSGPMFKPVDNPDGIYSTNCSICKYTCHLECDAPEIKKCLSMDENACCKRCSGKCSSSDHSRDSYHYKKKRETTASQELSKFKDFPWQVLATQVDNPPNVYSTNCSICMYTCHAECNAPDIYDCTSMNNGGKDAAHCQHCPQKCSWRHHKRSSYQYKIYKEAETRISHELQRKFKDFPMQVLATKVAHQGNVYSNNCSVCHFTCHFDCKARDVYNCSSMDSGGEDTVHCQYCPQKCHWKEHKRSPYYYKIYIEQLQETAAFQELQANDFSWPIFKPVDNPAGQYSTNCTMCKYTCHLDCHAPDIYNCSSMDNGGKDAARCTVCHDKCSWRDHNRASYHYTIHIEQKTTPSQEFKDFPWHFFFRQIDNAPNVYSTNCSTCKYTCHAECNAPGIYNCSSMNNGGEDAAHCQHCPQKCSWRHHKRSSYQYKIYKQEVSQELQRNKAQVSIRKVNNQVGKESQAHQKEHLLKKAEEELALKFDEIIEQLAQNKVQ